MRILSHSGLAFCLIALSLLFPGKAVAGYTTYWWSGNLAYKYESAELNCQAQWSYYQNGSNPYDGSYNGYFNPFTNSLGNADQGCSYHNNNANDIGYGDVDRFGYIPQSSQVFCPDPNVYDFATQACQDPATLCQGKAGTTEWMQGAGDSPPASVCVSSCAANITGVAVAMGGTWGGDYKYNGSSCSLPPPDPPPATGTETADQWCLSDGTNTSCVPKDPQGCGTFNGTMTCPPTLPETGQCQFWDGNYICAPGSSPQITKQDGTQETVPPDTTMTDGQGEKTVTDGQKVSDAYGSAGDGTTAGTNPPNNTPTQGTSTSTTTDNGDGTTTTETDQGTYDDQYDGSNAVTMAQVVGEFVAKVSGGPLFSAVGGFFDVPSGGSCPTWSTTVSYVGTLTFDQWCQPWAVDIFNVLSLAFLALAAWAAFRIAIL